MSESTPNSYVFEEKRGNIVLALAVAVLLAAVSAAAWAWLTVSTERQYALVAILVGLLVGFGVRIAGRGTTPIYGILAGLFALLACIAGNILAQAGFVAKEFDMPVMEVLQILTFDDIKVLLVETFSIMDILFYGLAVYEGYKLGFVRPQVETATIPQATGDEVQ